MEQLLNWWPIALLVAVVALLTWLVNATETFGKLWGYIAGRIPFIKNRTTLPIKLGWKRERVHKKLGKPQEDRSGFEVFYSYGFAVYYNTQQDTVDGIVATKVNAGTSFAGLIRGVKLGDSLDNVNNKIGSPRIWGFPNRYFSVAVWPKKHEILLAWIWRRLPDNDRGEDIKIGTIHFLAYCLESSFAYFETVVAAAIQEIRMGEKPGLLEETAMVKIDLKAAYFHKEYDIISLRGNLMGGANVIVKFENGQLLHFWVYPVAADRTPVIRSISTLDDWLGKGQGSENKN